MKRNVYKALTAKGEHSPLIQVEGLGKYIPLDLYNEQQKRIQYLESVIENGLGAKDLERDL